MELTNNEMYIINGGANYSLYNALVKAGSFLFSIGQSLGSAIRRITSGKYCEI